MSSNDSKLKHLEWAIKSRYSNQVCSLKLLTLFSNHEEIWRTKKFSRAAQDLTAVAFSLWRAAFLADKTGKRGIVFAHGKMFLEKIIEDNAISFPQDKSSKEWTFNYYVRNARASLQILNEHWPDTAPAYEGKKLNAMARWEYCQKLLNEAVDGFEKLLNSLEAQAKQTEQAKTVRIARKKRRAKARQFVLAQRS